MRFNQATNPLTKEEQNEVVIRSDFSLWLKDVLIKNLTEKIRFRSMFKYNATREKNKTINYDLYACLGYSYSGLVDRKNDTPYYVGRFMGEMKKLTSENLELKKVEIENYLDGFLMLYHNIPVIEGNYDLIYLVVMLYQFPVYNSNSRMSYVVYVFLTSLCDVYQFSTITKYLTCLNSAYSFILTLSTLE